MLVFSLLAAFIPYLAYVVLVSYGGSGPYASYRSLDLSIHPYTFRFIVAAFAGIVGLGFLFGPLKRRFTLAFLSIIIGNGAFWIIPMPDVIPIPEMSYTYLPWIGSLPVLAGISLIFLGVILKNPNVPRFALLSVPLLLGSYMMYPLIIASGNVLLLSNPSYFWLFLFLSAMSQLLMIVGAAMATYPDLDKRLKKNETEIMERPL